jgi:NADH-quinone oxidoreductase subunit G
VGFEIAHLVIATVDGKFTDFEGMIVIDPKLEKSKVDINIKAASINTANEERDKHLKSPDFFDTVKFEKVTFKSKKVFFWVNNKESFESFDGLLLRGDKNPNTKGLLKILDKYGLTATWGDLKSGIEKGELKTLVVAGPENQAVFPDLGEKITELSKVPKLIWLQAGKNEQLEALTGDVTLIPLKTYVEKDGTFVNHQGLEQKFKRVTTVVSEALTLDQAAQLMSGQEIKITTADTFIESNRRPDEVMLEHRKKNEFVFKRGTL